MIASQPFYFALFPFGFGKSNQLCFLKRRWVSEFFLRKLFPQKVKVMSDKRFNDQAHPPALWHLAWWLALVFPVHRWGASLSPIFSVD